MKFLKRHPLFAAIIAVIAVVLAAEIWYVQAFRTAAAKAEAEVHQRIADIERYQRQQPAPNDQNLRAAREDFAQNAEVLATMLRVLNVTGPDDLAFFQGEPTTRPDAWFEISQFVDRMTSEARKTNVALNPDERFGFATYTFEGPEMPYVRGVYRQHRIVEYLLGKLFAARPSALLGVQREQPLVQADPEAPAPKPGAAPVRAPSSGSGTADNGEIFVIDPQVSARTTGYVDTMAFRIKFSGQTTSLRGFMNALAAPDIPLVVRSVEVVENANQTDRTGTSAPVADRPRNPFGGNPVSDTAQPANNAAVPIVPENASVFTVTVELFEVKIRAPKIAANASTP